MPPKRKSKLPLEDAKGSLGNPFGALEHLRETLPMGEPSGSLQNSTSAEPPAASAKIVARFERKGHGGKSVTRISGIAEGQNELADSLKRMLGCGARVKGDAIFLQGDQRERIASTLENLGYTRIVVS